MEHATRAQQHGKQPEQPLLFSRDKHNHEYTNEYKGVDRGAEVCSCGMIYVYLRFMGGSVRSEALVRRCIS